MAALAGVFVLLLIIGGLYLLAAKLGMLKPEGAQPGEKPDEPLPYFARDRILSPAEASFHSVLRQALPILTAAASKPEPPLLLAKVRLSDILRVQGAKDPGATTRAQNRINAKHVDFLLCAPDTSRPILLIELDDRSHEREDRRARDSFVDRAVQGAGLPILHVKTS